MKTPKFVRLDSLDWAVHLNAEDAIPGTTVTVESQKGLSDVKLGEILFRLSKTAYCAIDRN